MNENSKSIQNQKDWLISVTYQQAAQVGEGLPLPLEKTGEDKDYVYFRTELPEFKFELDGIETSEKFWQLPRVERKEKMRIVLDLIINNKIVADLEPEQHTFQYVKTGFCPDSKYWEKKE